MQLHRSSHLCTDQQQLVILKDPAEDFLLDYRGIKVIITSKQKAKPLAGYRNWALDLNKQTPLGPTLLGKESNVY